MAVHNDDDDVDWALMAARSIDQKVHSEQNGDSRELCGLLACKMEIKSESEAGKSTQGWVIPLYDFFLMISSVWRSRKRPRATSCHVSGELKVVLYTSHSYYIRTTSVWAPFF